MFTFGDTEEEALSLNAEANQLFVSYLKLEGRTLLTEYLASRAIDYVIGLETPVVPTPGTSRMTRLTVAA